MDEHIPGEFCPRCMIGRLQNKSTTYLRLYRGMVLSVPDTPAYVCDYCGFYEFDLAALQSIQSLIGAEAFSSAETLRPLKTPQGEPLPNQDSQPPKP